MNADEPAVAPATDQYMTISIFSHYHRTSVWDFDGQMGFATKRISPSLQVGGGISLPPLLDSGAMHRDDWNRVEVLGVLWNMWGLLDHCKVNLGAAVVYDDRCSLKLLDTFSILQGIWAKWQWSTDRKYIEQ